MKDPQKMTLEELLAIPMEQLIWGPHGRCVACKKHPAGTAMGYCMACHWDVAVEITLGWAALDEFLAER